MSLEDEDYFIKVKGEQKGGLIKSLFMGKDEIEIEIIIYIANGKSKKTLWLEFNHNLDQEGTKATKSWDTITLEPGINDVRKFRFKLKGHYLDYLVKVKSSSSEKKYLTSGQIDLSDESDYKLWKTKKKFKGNANLNFEEFIRDLDLWEYNNLVPVKGQGVTRSYDGKFKMIFDGSNAKYQTMMELIATGTPQKVEYDLIVYVNRKQDNIVKDHIEDIISSFQSWFKVQAFEDILNYCQKCTSKDIAISEDPPILTCNSCGDEYRYFNINKFKKDVKFDRKEFKVDYIEDINLNKQITNHRAPFNLEDYTNYFADAFGQILYEGGDIVCIPSGYPDFQIIINRNSWQVTLNLSLTEHLQGMIPQSEIRSVHGLINHVELILSLIWDWDNYLYQISEIQSSSYSIFEQRKKLFRIEFRGTNHGNIEITLDFRNFKPKTRPDVHISPPNSIVERHFNQWFSDPHYDLIAVLDAVYFDVM